MATGELEVVDRCFVFALRVEDKPALCTSSSAIPVRAVHSEADHAPDGHRSVREFRDGDVSNRLESEAEIGGLIIIRTLETSVFHDVSEHVVEGILVDPIIINLVINDYGGSECSH